MVDEEHSHCWRCVLGRSCSSSNGCPIVSCPNCSVPMHECKSSDHIDFVCLEAVIPCVNSQHGCPVSVRRKDMYRHLQVCPSWMLQCRFRYERSQCERAFESDLAAMLPDQKFLASDIEFASLQQRPSKQEDEADQNGGPSHFKNMDVFCYSDSRGPLTLNNEGRIVVLQNESGKRCHFCITERRWPPLYGYPNQKQSRHHFLCGQIVRRHEWAEHYQNHQELEINLQLFAIDHCPLQSQGCNYSVLRYRLQPTNLQFDYSQEVGSFLIWNSQIVTDQPVGGDGAFAAALAKKQELALYGYEEEGSLDPLGQLPLEVLLRVLIHLDSLSLWCLSQVNQFFRGACQMLLDKKGMVFRRWYKDGKKWKQGSLTWMFSRHHDGPKGWVPVTATNTECLKPTIADHLKSCHYNVRRPLDFEAKFTYEVKKS